MNEDKNYSSSDYIHNIALKSLLEEIVKVNVDSLSISEAYDYLYRIQKDLNNIMRGKKIE